MPCHLIGPDSLVELQCLLGYMPLHDRSMIMITFRSHLAQVFQRLAASEAELYWVGLLRSPLDSLPCWMTDWREGDWFCPECNDHQFSRNSHCRGCLTPIPEESELEEVNRLGWIAYAQPSNKRARMEQGYACAIHGKRRSGAGWTRPGAIARTCPVEDECKMAGELGSRGCRLLGIASHKRRSLDDELDQIQARRE